MKEQEVQWVDEPPQVVTIRAKWGETERMVAPLRERPGQWAKLPKQFASPARASEFAHRLKRGAFAGVAAGDFETVARKDGDNPSVYARYIGGEA